MNEVCSACAFRYENNNIESIRQCCHETCSQFDTDCKIQCEQCIEKIRPKCKKNCSTFSLFPKTIDTKNSHSVFKSCMEEKTDTTEALRCCLERNKNNFVAQESCIDAYNSFKPVLYEDFRFSPDSKICMDKSLFVLGISIIIHILIIGNSIELPRNRFFAIGTIILFYFIIYIFLSYTN